MKKKIKSTSKSMFGLQNYEHPDLFGRWLGYDVYKVDRKLFKAFASLEVRDDHLSPAGRVHGGVVSAFFDFACGAACFTTLSKFDYCSTVELKVNYFRPIELGDTLEARTQVMFRGKRLCVVHGLLYKRGSKKPVAMATATFNVVAGEANVKKSPK